MDHFANSLCDRIELKSGTNPIPTTDFTLLQLREERLADFYRLQFQSTETQQFIKEQARIIAKGLGEKSQKILFQLPEHVELPALGDYPAWHAEVPAAFRRQTVTERKPRLWAQDLRTAVRRRLTALAQSPYPGVALSARILRHATAYHIIHHLLPDGNPAFFSAAEVEAADALSQDPRIPPSPNPKPFLPQWVAMIEDRLVVDSVSEAEKRISAMQDYASTLNLAVSLEPNIYTDEEYQIKRHGILAQLTTQGRALAHYQTARIVEKIHHRAAAGELNLGLSLSIPYFDDQQLTMRMLGFTVIPGRTLFVGAFVAQAAQREQARVAQDAHLSQTTRIHLLSILKELERAFAPAGY